VAYIIGGQPPEQVSGKAAPARKAKRARKGGSRVAGKSKKMGAGRYLCWSCGGRMKKKALHCKKCRKSRPAAVKAQAVTLAKSYGGKVRPVRAAPVTKAARPRCPNPACGARAENAADNCCRRCGWAYSAGRAAVAQKSADAYRAGIPQTAEWWEARARSQWNPADREQCYREARKARQAGGQENAHAAAQLMKASGARSLEEAWRMQTDPRAQQIISKLLGGRP
jgi:hypothetical protein